MSRSAFSLVELAIVLVILGVLTGGILSGQALIAAAEVRKAATQVGGLDGLDGEAAEDVADLRHVVDREDEATARERARAPRPVGADRSGHEAHQIGRRSAIPQ